MPFTRRQFMTGSVATLGALATAGRRRTTTRFEGVYTDRFTYRQSDSVIVYAALATPQTVDVDLLRNDTSATTRVARYPSEVSNLGNDLSPGSAGAWFSRCQEISLAGMSPGVYSVAISPEVMQESNRINTYNPFPSTNYLAHFVVTPSQRGSHSRLLWVHDSLTGVSYGSFGGQSVYGPVGVKTRTVSHARPGLDKGALVLNTLRKLRQSGFEFEYIDLHELTKVPSTYLDAYDLVLIVGPFEYVPHTAIQNLALYLSRGGNMFCTSAEFGLFRVRLDVLMEQLTTYRDHYEAEDPLHGTGSPHVAGVGMNVAETIWETEVTGQTLWAGYHVDPSAPTTGVADLTLHHGAQAGWILDGTGLGDGDVLPEGVLVFGTGNLVDFDDRGEPFVVEQQRTRTPAGTIVWATAPTEGARQWWHRGPTDTWPIFAGYATATYQQRASGAQVVTLPRTPQWSNPVSARILTNIVGGLATRA